MWFEILPGAAIIFVAMGVPHFSAYVLNKLVLGNAYRRGLYEKKDRLQYHRDRRLGDGNPYKVVGLEAIPDE